MFRESDPFNPARAVAILFVFRDAVEDATPEQRTRLAETRTMLEEGRPFSEWVLAIFECMGPDWVPHPDTIKFVEELE